MLDHGSSHHPPHPHPRRARTARNEVRRVPARTRRPKPAPPRGTADPELRHAFLGLLSGADDRAAINEAIAVGSRLVPGLRSLLVRSYPAMSEARRRTVHVLAGLHAVEPILEYLAVAPHPGSPSEDPGEGAVLDAAARALGAARDPRALTPLLRLALDRRTPAAIEALARLDCPQVVPGLVAGLYDDRSRATAERALRRWSRAAAPILLEVVERAPWVGAADDRHRRARRAAARMLAQIDLAPHQLRRFGRHLRDPDVEVSARAALAILRDGEDDRAGQARARLAELYPDLLLPLRREVDRLRVRAPTIAVAAAGG